MRKKKQKSYQNLISKKLSLHLYDAKMLDDSDVLSIKSSELSQMILISSSVIWRDCSQSKQISSKWL